MNIFREEALNHQTDSDYGEIVLPASLGLSVSALTTLFIFLCLILFILYGSYTRKAHLSGIVMPSSGLVKITPQYAGYVTKLTASEGQHIIAGETHYHISGEHFNEQGAGTLAAIRLSLQTQFTMLTSQQTLELRDNSQQQHAIQQRIVSLKPQVKSAEKRLSLAVHQAALAVSVMERYKKLADTHYVSDIEYQQKQIDVSTSQQNVEDQRQGLLQLHTAMEAAKDDLDHLIVQGESRKAEMDRQLQVIRQQQDELAGK